MRANGDAYRVQNLHQHQHNEEFVQYPESLGCKRPTSEALPQYFTCGCDGHQGRDSQQHRENGIDDYLGFAQIVVKVAAQSVFDHTIRLQFKSKTESIVRPKLLAATFLRRLDSGLRITIGLRSVSVCWCSPLPLMDGGAETTADTRSYYLTPRTIR